jgi:hypothetical protein
VIAVFVGLKKPKNSYTSVVICDDVASLMLRPTDESPMIPVLAGGVVVDDVSDSVVFGGTAAAAGSAKVAVTPATGGAATAAAAAGAGADAVALAAVSCGTVAGPCATVRGTASVELPLHAANTVALTIMTAAAERPRPISENFKQTS